MDAQEAKEIKSRLEALTAAVLTLAEITSGKFSDLEIAPKFQKYRKIVATEVDGAASS